MSKPPPASGATGRIPSLDGLRGLTILVMLFVNDLAGVQGAPAWMKHVQPSDADGMTFVDVVFPAFLFLVGTSIPSAIGRRLEQGEPRWKVGGHILLRTVGLLVLGVLMVNTETMANQGPLSPPLWTLLLYVGVILVWNAPPREPGTRRRVLLALRALGVILLVALALLYRSREASGFLQLRPQWWGILGLIGWAYLVACLAYALLRKQLAGMVGMIALLYCVYVADAGGAFAWLPWVPDWVSIGEVWGSQAAIVVSGVVLGMVLTSAAGVQAPAGRLRWACGYGLALAAAGLLLHSAHDLHRMFIINKNAATPPWCLLCSALTVWVWVGISWLMDVRHWQRWAVAVAPAGQNPLLAYVLAPLLYAAFELLATALRCPNYYAELGSSFAVGFWRAVVFAFAVTWLARGLRRLGVQLRL
jgi:heparan-alpha-glucosaminide N-acetyltransferase